MILHKHNVYNIFSQCLNNFFKVDLKNDYQDSTHENATYFPW